RPAGAAERIRDRARRRGSAADGKRHARADGRAGRDAAIARRHAALGPRLHRDGRRHRRAGRPAAGRPAGELNMNVDTVGRIFRSGMQKGHRTPMRSAALATLGIVLATAASAQDDVARRQAIEIAARVPLEKPVTGAPYSAETVVEGNQTLADGNRIIRKTTGRVYRDGDGRTRREEDGQPMTARTPNGPVTMNGRTSISIVDPVAGFSYSLDPERKIAWRTPIGTSAAIMDKIDAVKSDMTKAELEKRAARTAGATDKPSTDARAVEEQKALEERKRAMAAAGLRGGPV